MKLKRYTIPWWIDLMEYLRQKKQFEFADGIREMIESYGYKIGQTGKEVFVRK